MSRGRLTLHNLSQQLERLISDFQLIGNDLFDKRFTQEQNKLLRECSSILDRVRTAMKERQRGVLDP